jgi:tetratricopeptide (TPR) repeat protein
MADSINGRKIHALAEQAREAGNFLEALKFTDEATLAYQKDNDLLGLSEVQSSRQSTFKHLYRHTEDTVFLTLEKYSALAAVEIAEKSGIKEALGIPYHNVGKYYIEAQDYQNAAGAFQKAVENLIEYPSSRHSNASVIADIKGHQFAAEYHNGDKTALERALSALRDLEQASPHEVSLYARNAWLSGAHLRIAEMLVSDNPKLARSHLAEAKKIIEEDKSQILRKEELEKLEKRLNQSRS